MGDAVIDMSMSLGGYIGAVVMGRRSYARPTA
jgi:hypothetical protein